MDDDRLVRQLEELMELSALVNSTLDTAVVRRRAVEAATRLVDAERGSLLLVEPESGELVFEVALGDEAVFGEARLARGEGIAGWVAETGDAAIVHDVRSDPRFCGGLDERSEFVTRDMVCVPVTSRGRVIGVLQAINRRDGSFDERDAELLTVLGHQVAIAIENAGLYSDLKETFYETAAALAETVDKRDPYTGGHTRRVMEYSVAIGERMGLSDTEMDTLRLSAILHDVGKVGVPDAILQKPGRLDDDEWTVMAGHAEAAADILGHVTRLRDALPGVRWHHERLDGTGYPDRLQGDAVPVLARIIAVADAFDAMTTTRAYSTARSPEAAIAELRRCAGTQFDPRAVEAMNDSLEDERVRYLL